MKLATHEGGYVIQGAGLTAQKLMHIHCHLTYSEGDNKHSAERSVFPKIVWG